MKCFSRTSVSLVSIAALSALHSLGAEELPFLSVDLKSYRSVVDDAARVTESMEAGSGDDVEAQLLGMLGAETVAQIDQDKPWHLAVWMEDSGQDLLVAIYLPASDFEAFQVAAEDGFIGQQSYEMLDHEDYVILLREGPTDSEFAKQAIEFTEKLPAKPVETLSVVFRMNDNFRTMGMGGLQMMKPMIMAEASSAEMAQFGLPEGAYEKFMESYFSVLGVILRDLSTLQIDLSVSKSHVENTTTVTPIVGSESAAWLGRQNVDITDIASEMDWTEEMVMIGGISKMNDSEKEVLNDLLSVFLPFYGLSSEDAEQWVKSMDASLPLKTGYSMRLSEGFSSDGFYEILEGSAKTVYEEWIALALAFPTAETNPNTYYSKVDYQKDVRMEGTHSVDRLELGLNFDHPSFQLPGQKEQMEAFFDGGQLTYEMSVVGDRIYMSSEGNLKKAIERNGDEPPFLVNSETRLAAAFDMISLMEMGLATVPEVGERSSDSSSEDTHVWFSMDLGETLEMRMVVPLAFYGELSKLDI